MPSRVLATIRSLPVRPVISVVGVAGVVASAAGLVVADLLTRGGSPTATVLTTGAVLCLAAVVHNETALGVERLRRRPPGGHHVDLNSAWTFAGAVLLPPVAASAVVLVVHSYLYLRVRRPLRMPGPRHLYRTATVVLAVYSAATAIALPWPAWSPGSPAGAVPVTAGLLAYGAVRAVLVLGAVAVSEPGRRALRARRSGHEMTLELATLCLGALAAGMLGASTPLVLLLAIPPILALHRTLPLRRLEERADTDAKTGLLNASGWHARATRALHAVARDRTVAGLLVLDLDLFKAVNDRHGHLAGDEVLGAIAEALRAEVRSHDVVGRFGGEEFVVLLPHLSGSADRDEVHRIGDRIRRRVGQVRVAVPAPEGPRRIEAVTVSVGGAVFPQDGDGLTALLETADSALYAAKRAGRDTVRTGRHTFPAAGPDGHGPGV